MVVHHLSTPPPPATPPGPQPRTLSGAAVVLVAPTPRPAPPQRKDKPGAPRGRPVTGQRDATAPARPASVDVWWRGRRSGWISLRRAPRRQEIADAQSHSPGRTDTGHEVPPTRWRAVGSGQERPHALPALIR